MVLQRIADMLRGLFRANEQPRAEEAADCAARLEKKVLALVDHLPTLPDAAARALALANDPDAEFADLARLIESDAAIATGLLRVANSAFYTGGFPAVKLRQALVRLGLWQCKNLILSFGMRSAFQQMAGPTQDQCKVLWRHGYVTACLARQINRGYRLGFEGEEFSAGLLHDLGRILLVLADPECGDRAGAMNFDEGPDRLERERAAIGIDHCALGGWFGELSRLPDSLIQTMRLHHEPELSEPSHRLVALVAAADHMANHLQRGEAIEAYNPVDNAALGCLVVRWPDARVARLLGEIPSLMDESARAATDE